MLSPVETVVELIVVVVPLTVRSPLTTMLSLNVLAPAIVCVPVVLTTVLSTSKLLALAVKPSPPTTLITPELYVRPAPANPASVVGSIGVVSAGFGFDKAIAKLGVERRVYTAGEAKMTLDPFQPERDEEVARLKALQADIHQQFISHVEARRGSRLNGEHEDLFSGAFWTGQRAVELGLVDSLGECRQTILQRFGDDTEVMFIEPKRKFLAFGLPGMRSQLVQETADFAIERAYFSRFGL